MTRSPGHRRAAPARRPAGLGDPHLSNALDALKAGFGGALDTASLGLFDYGAAGVDTLRGKGDFAANMARQRAQDAADMAKRPWARGVGMAGGAILPLLVPGAGAVGAARAALGSRGVLGSIAKTAPRAIKSAVPSAGRAAKGRLVPKVGHVLRTGAVTGGIAGGAGQAAGDLVVDRRVSPANVVSGVVGGAAGGLTAPFAGHGAGGAVEGAVTPTVQALLRGEAPSLERAARGAALGGALGRSAGALGAARADELSQKTKERLGERLSQYDALLTGRVTVGKQQRWHLAGFKQRKGRASGYTVADFEVKAPWEKRASPLEAKFGDHATLSDRQQEALEQLPMYVVKHFLPRDVGAMTGVGAAGLGGSWVWDESR